jgi:hypothetical protein
MHALLWNNTQESFAVTRVGERVVTDTLLDHDLAASVDCVMIAAEEVARVSDIVQPNARPTLI